MPFSPSEKTKTYFLIFLFSLTAIICLLWIVSHNNAFITNPSDTTSSTQVWADIYQDGVILQSICLNSVSDTYTFTITSSNGGTNTIAVHPGSIGILSASCPDKLCVKQGFISTSLLPITCLPNHLVIQLRSEMIDTSDAPDILTYG